MSGLWRRPSITWCTTTCWWEPPSGYQSSSLCWRRSCPGCSPEPAALSRKVRYFAAFKPQSSGSHSSHLFSEVELFNVMVWLSVANLCVTDLGCYNGRTSCDSAFAVTAFSSSGGKSHLRKTQRKLEPSPETKAVIRSSAVWQVEDEFYRFAEQQFNFVRQKTMAATTGGRLRPRPRAYHYEKIRPNKPK